MADIGVVSKERALWASFGVGAPLNWDDNRNTVYGEPLARTSVQNFGDSNAMGAKRGVAFYSGDRSAGSRLAVGDRVPGCHNGCRRPFITGIEHDFSGAE